MTNRTSDGISIAELRTYLGWTDGLEALAVRAVAVGRLTDAYQRASVSWWSTTHSSSLSSCTAVVVGNTQAWRDEHGVDHIPASDAGFAFILFEELRRVLQAS